MSTHEPKLHDRPAEHWSHDGEHTVTRYRENGLPLKTMRMQQHVAASTIDQCDVRISQDIAGWGIVVAVKDTVTGNTVNFRLEIGDSIQQAAALAVNELVGKREEVEV